MGQSSISEKNNNHSIYIRVQKKNSFADDRLNVIPAGEADICGNAVCLSKIVENDQTNCIYIGRRCEVLATQGPAE